MHFPRRGVVGRPGGVHHFRGFRQQYYGPGAESPGGGVPGGGYLRGVHHRKESAGAVRAVLSGASAGGLPSVHKPCKQDDLRGENARGIPQDCHGAGIQDIKKSDGSSPSDFFLRVDQ